MKRQSFFHLFQNKSTIYSQNVYNPLLYVLSKAYDQIKTIMRTEKGKSTLETEMHTGQIEFLCLISKSLK